MDDYSFFTFGFLDKSLEAFNLERDMSFSDKSTYESDRQQRSIDCCKTRAGLADPRTELPWLAFV